MISVITLPVAMALSWVPAQENQPAAPTAQQQTGHVAQQAEVIKCPLTGEEIPSCCCPVKK